jgi:superoxide dismutase
MGTADILTYGIVTIGASGHFVGEHATAVAQAGVKNCGSMRLSACLTFVAPKQSQVYCKNALTPPHYNLNVVHIHWSHQVRWYIVNILKSIHGPTSKDVQSANTTSKATQFCYNRTSKSRRQKKLSRLNIFFVMFSPNPNASTKASTIDFPSNHDFGVYFEMFANDVQNLGKNSL